MDSAYSTGCGVGRWRCFFVSCRRDDIDAKALAICREKQLELEADQTLLLKAEANSKSLHFDVSARLLEPAIGCWLEEQMPLGAEQRRP